MAVTLAATAVARVGSAVARAERDRRSRARRERDRQFALLPAESPAAGLRRIALAQIDLALEQLDGEIDPQRAARAVHETRKALKRLRALVRMLENELPRGAFAYENAALRDAGRRLAGARDGEVTLNTLEQLLQRHPRELGRRGSLARLHERLVVQRDSAALIALVGDTAPSREVIDELRAMRSRVLQWQLPDRAGIELAEDGLSRVYRQGRRRYRRVASGKGDRARAMHEWRKRVKDLRHAAEMIDRKDPGASEHGHHRGRNGGPPARRRRRARRRKEAARIRRLAKRADALGEVLGEDHDLAVFAERVRTDMAFQLGRRTRKTLLRLIARRRRQLRRRALREGERIYRRRPKAFVARVREAYASGARG